MHEPKLTRQERKILEGIEQELRSDEGLDLHGLEDGRPRRAGSWSAALGRHLGLCTAALGAMSVLMFVIASASASPAPLWLFAAVWVATAVCLIRLLLVRADRWAARRQR
ncbi:MULTISPECIES: hypothetical protein [unclassified Streptomyces]|uniref:hypothetical protein n=1 Tax=unclassified Streptomyces TaxID=2593676 RepID=UPI0006F22DE8|nr:MULTISPECIES: hypothetical protein [unclassified Streptomyces]KQX56295.1 hypothetical protein ASD33_30085 [Streptomyces sp. Root1304]KRA97110.1 hypothetical protein ASE09_26895 [Streptomyces sp. Root66D1]